MWFHAREGYNRIRGGDSDRRFNEQTGFHHVHFAVAEENCLFGTACNEETDYMNFRMDTLESVTDAGESDEVMRFWVQRDRVRLPFITKGLKSLKVDVQVKKSGKRGKLCKKPKSKSMSDSDVESDNKKAPVRKSGKRGKPGKKQKSMSDSDVESDNSKRPKPKITQSKKKAQYNALFEKMRRGGL